MDPSQHYRYIADTISYIRSHFREQPSLEELAARVNLSPYHFQRVFTEWSGVSPKKFLQYTSLEYAKRLLSQQASLFDAAWETGLSGTGRLHDLFVSIEAMTPGEYKNGGASLSIAYRFADSPFGRVLVAATEKGLCYLSFMDEEMQALAELQQQYPNALLQEEWSLHHDRALALLGAGSRDLQEVKLHLRGTAFQLKVWEGLLKIPAGQVSTYGRLAENLGQTGASRAVGTAIGSNPVACLIPCHRVIRSTGELGGYRWGETRKAAMIGREAVFNGDLSYP